MKTAEGRQYRGSLKGAVYGDLIGSPYMIENTYNRYFELGESRKAYSHGRVRTFFSEVTEVSHAASAVTSWLIGHRDEPTVENLQAALHSAYDHHPRGGWTEQTRLYLTGERSEPSQMSDWAPVVRAIPIAAMVRDDIFLADHLSEVCVKATCSNQEAVDMARAVTHSIHMALNGKIYPEIFTMLEHQFGLTLTWDEEDLRSELRGEVRRPLEMLGKPIEGAYRYVVPDNPVSPSARIVTEAALMAVFRSDSWEDAVRRAVSYGGPSNAVAAIAGGLAEALYGEVTPTIIGKLSSHLPIDLGKQIDSLESSPQVRVKHSGEAFSSIARDAVDIISLGPGKTVYVVPEDKKYLRALINGKVPNPQFITPDKVDEFMKSYQESRTGTYAYGIRPESRVLYLQDGERLVSPSQYIAPGMPPLQERQRNLKEFLSLRSWCVDKQAQLNSLAGNEGAGQIHYGNAYHMWIGSRKIEFFFGDQSCGKIYLDSRGIMKVDFGEHRDVSVDSRFENHREQAWASRELFSVQDTINPMNRLQQIREAITFRLLDEGNGDQSHEIDTRYMDEDERRETFGVSNIDHLDKIDPGESMGLSAESSDNTLLDSESPVEGRNQSTNRIFSIGYGARTQEGFINTLKMSGIDTVVDVRSIPRSKYVPHFNEDEIFDALSSEGISYLSAGDRLGGRFTDYSVYESGRVSWPKVSQSEDFRNAISSLESLCEDGHIVAVVCSEGDPLSCHRFGLLSRTLAEDGMDVRHILTNGEVVSHEEMETRLVDKYTRLNKISSVCTGTYPQMLDEAYKIMNEEHGYKPKERSFIMGSGHKFRH